MTGPGPLPLDHDAPRELLLVGGCAPRDPLLRRALEIQDPSARDDARALATTLLTDSDEADQHLADPATWVLRVVVRSAVVAREPGILAWTAVP